MATEWGVKHTQGIATYKTEREAVANLEWHMRSWQRSQSKNHPEARPRIVSREVTEWTEPMRDVV